MFINIYWHFHVIINYCVVTAKFEILLKAVFLFLLRLVIIIILPSFSILCSFCNLYILKSFVSVLSQILIFNFNIYYFIPLKLI